MAAIIPSHIVAALPADLVAAVVSDATRAADRVSLFLAYLGIEATPEKPRRMPARFLLYLGIGLWLWEWESKDIFIHREAGLSDARQVMENAFMSLSDPASDPTELTSAVVRLSIQRFAWGGLQELGADVVLDEPQEEALLEALADFYWETHSRTHTCR